MKILFVCHGNICRSPMAEFIMRKMLCEAGISGKIEVSSAAVSSEELGNGVYPPAKAVLKQHHISCDGKYARKICREDYDEFDMLIGMDTSNIKRMHSFFNGDPDGKIFRLLDFTERKGADVADPWYSGDFDVTYRDIVAGCSALLTEIISAG